MGKAHEHNLQWFEVDAEGKTLGRLSTEIAKILRGKHRPTFTPHADLGDGVIVVNADKVKVTGAKEKQKVYTRYTGYPGGLRTTTLEVMRERHPTRILEHAVKGMMPKKSTLARQQLTRLRLFAGAEHDMQAQKPLKVNI
jgi:large subunit ribosomal protein L13